MKGIDKLKSLVRGMLSSGATDEEVRQAVKDVDVGTSPDDAELDQVIHEVEGEEATDEDVRLAVEAMEAREEDS